MEHLDLSFHTFEKVKISAKYNVTFFMTVVN